MFVRIALVWVTLASLYLLLAGDVSMAEVFACIICSSLGTALASSLSVVARRSFAGSPPFYAFARPVTGLLPETFMVGRRLVATAVFGSDHQAGAFVRQPFEPTDVDPSRGAMRRAFVLLGVSLAPRTFVIRGETSDTLLLHALPPKDSAIVHRWPV